MKILTVSITGLPALEQSIKGLGDALDTVKILDEGAAVIYNRIRTRFLMETDANGVKWPPSQAAIRRAKSGRGGGTLFDTGRLFRSIQLYAETMHSRSIGTNVTSPQGYPYAEKHQFGIGFPKREFLGINEEDAGVMAKVIVRRIAKGLLRGKTP